MRYYHNEWVSQSTTHTRQSGNVGLALLIAVCLLALIPMLMFLHPVVNTAAVEAATVFVQVDKDGSSGISGSGVLISPTGYILTNMHVARPDGVKPRKITVFLFSGTTRRVQFPAEIVAFDQSGVTPENNDKKSLWHDWAVLKVNADRALPYLHLGDSKKVEAQERVLSIGFPAGEGTATSANGPSAKTEQGNITRADADDQGGIIRLTHSCSLYNGSSGGPLADVHGDLIGMNTAGMIRNGALVPGENYAIPIHMIYDQIKQYNSSGQNTGSN